MTVIFRGQRRPDESGFRFRVMSTFSGIGAASISWDEAQYEFVAYAEPAAFPAHVLHYRRGAGRPRYLPDPQQVGISDELRRFTPLECERLQGFPDHWTDVPFCGELVTDGHRYKALGNSMPCPVMSFIGNVLEAHMDIQHFAEENLDIFRRKRGRPPKGERPMSAKERQRRRRERIRGEAGLLLKEKFVLDHETKTQLLSRVQQIRRLILGEPTPDLLIQLDLLEDLIDKLGPSLSQHT